MTHFLRVLIVIFILLCAFCTGTWSSNRASADDWPTWRCDAGRTASTDAAVSEPPSLQWERKLPPLKPAYRNVRLQFDAGYEPIVMGQTMFVGSSRNDSVTAYSTDTGEQKWRFFTEGPVRFAPVAWQDRLYFGSDDGHMYCTNAVDGSLVWKFQAVPSNRKLLGNGRLISVWPVRGGPVIDDGIIYFAAGVWPFEGVFLYALDARTGDIVWLNDQMGYVYGQHPHAAEAFGGLTPQGYLVVSGDDLFVPCGSALPARFDKTTGHLESFALPKQGRYPGGWFAASSLARRRGKPSEDNDELVLDVAVNSDRHEDGDKQGPGATGIRSTITVGEQAYLFADGYPGVSGEITSMLAADRKLFVVTKQGSIRCFGPGKVVPKTFDDSSSADSAAIPVSVRKQAASIVRATNVTNGYCIVCGIEDGQLIEALLEQTQLHIIGIDTDPNRIRKQRAELDGNGLYGQRVTLHVGTLQGLQLPPYLASLVVCSDMDDVEQDASTNDGFVSAVFDVLRPYGGTAWFNLKGEEATTFAEGLQHTDLLRANLTLVSDAVLIRRSGPLPGSTNYAENWAESQDELVKAPLGVLWFDDSVGHFKRSPQPFFVDGVMISHDKSWRGYPSGSRPPYPLKQAVYSDVYTGRVFSDVEVILQTNALPSLDITQQQPSQYRPPTQKDDWKPEQPVVGERVNPLTGVREPRAIVKSYGCDGGFDYGLMFTMRSGTAAYYDKRIESGTIHISGPRSGCTNSIIPANGLLNVPYFYQGCTCSYPLPVGLALYHMPAEYEQWTVWGPGKPQAIQRLGINLGAPGDRVTDSGTLWLDYPVVGGPSPELAVTVEPENATPFYHHSLWIEGGIGWPWVAASGLTGVSSVRIDGLKKSEYTVRLYFAESDTVDSGQRVFDVSLQGQPVIESLDIVSETGGRMRSLVWEFHNVTADGSLKVTLHASNGIPTLSGIELIANGLNPGEIITLTDRSNVQLVTED
jgi:PQQ-like domain/Malectin domain